MYDVCCVSVGACHVSWRLALLFYKVGWGDCTNEALEDPIKPIEDAFRFALDSASGVIGAVTETFTSDMSQVLVGQVYCRYSRPSVKDAHDFSVNKVSFCRGIKIDAPPLYVLRNTMPVETNVSSIGGSVLTMVSLTEGRLYLHTVRSHEERIPWEGNAVGVVLLVLASLVNRSTTRPRIPVGRGSGTLKNIHAACLRVRPRYVCIPLGENVSRVAFVPAQFGRGGDGVFIFFADIRLMAIGHAS